MHLAPRLNSRSPLAALRAAAVALLLALPLAGCVANGAGDGASAGGSDAASAAEPAIETGTAPPPPDLVLPVASSTAPGTVDHACTTDADCAVKDVGSCCGYSPACVNKDSPTFPEQVKAECAKNDMTSICGFRDIAGCQCVEGRCAALDAGEGAVR